MADVTSNTPAGNPAPEENLWQEQARKMAHEAGNAVRESLPMKIGIGAVTLAAIFGAVSYNINLNREANRPVAFSEIEKTTRAFASEGKAVPPLTRVYSKVSDTVMKVNEASNIAFEISRSNSAFAKELENKVEKSLKVHKLIGEYANEIPQDADEALQSLSKLLQAIQELPPVNSAFSQAWTENHHDVYHTESRTRTVCSGSGSDRSCHTETYYVQVYDYTIHTYNYYPQHGIKADQLLSAYLEKHPDMRIEERLVPATQTGPENEYAMEKSMKKVLEGKMIMPEQALAFANKWMTGSNLTKYEDDIQGDHADLQRLGPQWKEAKYNARDHRYITYSHFDSGPKEYRISEAALKNGQDLYREARKIVDGIKFAREAAPQLDAKIHEFIGVALDGKPGDADKLRGEVMDLAQGLYDKNFENGFDVSGFKWGEVILLSLLGATLGGLAGAGTHHVMEKRFMTGRQRDYFRGF